MNSKEWRELRKRKLQEFPYCELHKEHGIKVRATCVHHKKEVESALTNEEMRKLCYDYDNLQALCNECHHRLHQAKGNNTKEAHRKRKEQELARWINRLVPPRSEEPSGEEFTKNTN